MSALLLLAGAFQAGEAQAAGEAAPESGGAAPPRVLVAYFSWSGNSRKIAAEIHRLVGGDLFEIEVASPYPSSYNDTVDLAKEEQARDARPELKSRVEDMSRYEVVILGYPNWWSSIPMPVATFLEANDFTGKTILPFCSHGGSAMGRSVSHIMKLARGATVREGLPIRSDGGRSLERDLKEWLEKSGLAVGG
jgi:flavodoxin